MGRTEVRQIAVQKLSNVGLNSDVADLYPNELSGGVKKRVGLARVISDTPKILLIDEPTAGLDPIMTNNINQLIKRNAEIIGATTVSVTSDMDGWTWLRTWLRGVHAQQVPMGIQGTL